ncbi:MAG: peptidoglycan DD-metalloendopeptidase family protein [Burkholderiales bacterium]|nr:peptidoglycan DD-metalloendopeptidase family protein [Burkholderiales bacterium]
MTHRLPTVVLIALIFSAATGAPAAEAPNAPNAARAKAELGDLRGRIQTLQKRLTDAEGTRTEAADALRESERAISDANRSLRELTAQSTAANRRLTELRAASQEQEAALKKQRQQLSEFVYQQYVSGRREPLQLLLNLENPNETARRMHYYSHVARSRAELIAELRAGLENLSALMQETERKTAELAEISAEQTAQKQQLEQERRARNLMLARISRDIQSQKREIGTLQRDENRLARLVEQLGRIVSRPPPRTPGTRLRNERLPDGADDGSPFQALKGRLALPVRGELGNRFGSQRSDGGVVWRGLFIASRAGEEVKAIAAGRVVYADWLRGFGNLLIIDHGNSYMSLYGNNETLYKQVGDAIRGGETIATVGNSGGNADSGLYFEMRYQGKPFDPLTWVNVK